MKVEKLRFGMIRVNGSGFDLGKISVIISFRFRDSQKKITEEKRYIRREWGKFIIVPPENPLALADGMNGG